jgi:hypothetical protein
VAVGVGLGEGVGVGVGVGLGVGVGVGGLALKTPVVARINESIAPEAEYVARSVVAVIIV